MFSALSPLLASLQYAAFQITPLLAQIENEEEEVRTYSIEVALVMLCVILGLMVALRPSKRTTEFDKPVMEDDE